MQTVEVPNWIFHTTVISKALDLLDLTIHSKEQDDHHTFLLTESGAALEESREALRAIMDALRRLETDPACIRCK